MHNARHDWHPRDGAIDSRTTVRKMPARDDLERATLIALLRERPQGLTWADITVRVAEATSAQPVWQALVEPSLFDDGLPAPIDRALHDMRSWQAAGFDFYTFQDAAYPAQLREIHQMPPVIFCRGRTQPDERAVSVVGTRRPSDVGLNTASEIAEALAVAGFTVVSGLAAGIDAAAHSAALKAGGRTVAVIGTGIDRSYPPENRDLQNRIAADGLVVSQFWPGTGPARANFPLRNATMSGYGNATIVVEAGQTSGARIQARVSAEHGRRVILTDDVLRANDWARDLLRRPGVHGASSVAEILAIATEISRDPLDTLAELLEA